MCMFSNPNSAVENHREPEEGRMLLTLVVLSWGESKAVPGTRSRCARQGFLLCAWWRAEGNAGNGTPEHTGFLQTPPAAAPVSGPFQSWELHHPVPIKPALEVKLADADEEVV